MSSHPIIPGYLFQRWVGEQFLGVAPLTFSRGRIVVGDETQVFDSW